MNKVLIVHMIIFFNSLTQTFSQPYFSCSSQQIFPEPWHFLNVPISLNIPFFILWYSPVVVKHQRDTGTMPSSYKQSKLSVFVTLKRPDILF